MKPVWTATWVDLTTNAIKVATIKMMPAYIKPQDSLAQRQSILMELLLHNFMCSFIPQRSGKIPKYQEPRD